LSSSRSSGFSSSSGFIGNGTRCRTATVSALSASALASAALVLPASALALSLMTASSLKKAAIKISVISKIAGSLFLSLSSPTKL